MDQHDRARTSLLRERCGVARSIGRRGEARAFPLLNLICEPLLPAVVRGSYEGLPPPAGIGAVKPGASASD
jgi:hypothetical protein